MLYIRKEMAAGIPIPDTISRTFYLKYGDDWKLKQHKNRLSKITKTRDENKVKELKSFKP